MESFRRIGIFLKNTKLDRPVMGFASHIAGTGDHELLFAHVANPEDPDCGPQPNADEFERMVRAQMPDNLKAKIETRVLTGDQTDTILRCTRNENFDLVILGRKLPSSQLGLGAKISRIVRKTPCSVLVIPELCEPHFDRIMVAIDCSDHSRRAVETALEIAKASRATPQMVAVTVRSVGLGYDVAGHTFQEAADQQVNFGQKQLTDFLAEIPTDGIDIAKMVLISESPALAVTHAAMARKVDIVIVGSRGASSTTAALLGSNSEQLLATCALPTMVVKEKGETMSLLEAIFSMD